jgi:hypothetical protein
MAEHLADTKENYLIQITPDRFYVRKGNRSYAKSENHNLLWLIGGQTPPVASFRQICFPVDMNAREETAFERDRSRYCGSAVHAYA